jgi:anti-sigma factor ChrR (cupin superfamily)
VAEVNQKVHESTAIGDLLEGHSSYAGGNGIDWTQAKPGVRVKWLYCSPDGLNRTGLFELEAGASTALHEHTSLEQIYVLSGAFHDGTRLLCAGDHCVRPPGVVHSAYSEAGAVALVIYSPT